MKKAFLLIATLTMSLTLAAQTTRKEMYKHLEYTGSNYCSYFGGKTKLTKVPEGYRPFYISHYGRHGSRYMLSNKAYHETIDILQKADSAGVLTKLGRKTLGKLRRAYADHSDPVNKLTPEERQKVIETVKEKRFSSIPPHEIVPYWLF